MMPGNRRWIWRRLWLRGLLLAVVLLIGAAVWLHLRIRASLPQLDGVVRVEGLSGEVTIERDVNGVPTITATSREDTAFALGFLHAQDRFFQIDLMRRLAAGRLSELFGARTIAVDEKFRKHRFRELAVRVIESLPPPQANLLSCYSQGVNSGLRNLGGVPFEYLLLRATPAACQPEDSILILMSMLADLQPIDAEREIGFGRLREQVPLEVFDFLVRNGSAWDAALDGSLLEPPPIPPADVWSLRAAEIRPEDSGIALNPAGEFLTSTQHPEFRPGSNCWAISSQLGRDGRAMLASDMHLGLRVPATWYRVVMNTPTEDGSVKRLVGVTLPGSPLLVEGSNGSVAWGYTNSYGDFGDVVELKQESPESDEYETPSGRQTLQRYSEPIRIAGGEVRAVDYEWSVWGPVVEKRAGKRFVHHWVGDDPAAFDMKSLALESATTAEAALRIANESGIPHLNFIVADSQGNIGWTLCGRIPRRTAAPTNTPVDWSTGQGMWDGYLEPDEYPRLFNPADGRLWTANNRVLGGSYLDQIGHGGFDLGARAGQIRDRLRAQELFAERDMLEIQLDKEARFLQRWQTLLGDVIRAHPECVSDEFRDGVEHWRRQAAVESVDYRMVHEFRWQVMDALFGFNFPGRELPKPGELAAKTGIRSFLDLSYEDVAWQLAQSKPLHWLPQDFATWDEFLAAAARMTQRRLSEKQPLSKATWGSRNTVKIQHPLGRALPAFSSWLMNMPAVQLPGDANMPRVQTPSAGASQRMVVSPGQEEQGIYHQPGGQSGHPYSPFYRAGFDDWANGNPSPLLPGPARHKLVLVKR